MKAPQYLPLFPFHGNLPGAVLAEGELLLDFFAGIGGTSTGIERAAGRPVDHAINHNPVALGLHRVNHPHSHHWIEDVWEADPRAVTGGRPVALAWFSPDCFPAGTMVLTREGYRPIEEIAVGDKVLTHKKRWRRVVETSSAVRPLMRLRGHGHPGLLVSPEHPFYARLRRDVWRKEPRGYQRALEPADWAPASMLDRGWYWSSPMMFPDSEVPEVPVHRGRGLAVTPELLWLAGRYLADGWTRLAEDRAELVLTCGEGKAVALRERLGAWPRLGERSGSDEMAWHERQTATAVQFSTSHKGLVEWLREHFGHLAHGKHLPGWALGMPRHLREALMDGYLAGDGNTGMGHGTPLVMCSTVSKALAFGLKSLACSLGFAPTVYFNANPTNVIQGRAVNAMPIWAVRWRPHPDQAHRQDFQEDGLLWAPIRDQEHLETDAVVYNIGVEEDESYVVEGIVVHNCRHHSKAKGGKPVEKKIRGLAWVALRWAALARPRIIFLENVEEFKDWGRLTADGRPDPRRKGETFRSFVNALRHQGYEVQWRELRACDYGAPTIRKRLFLIARRDGQPIVWPAPTHGAPGSPKVLSGERLPYRTAGECIDWYEPSRSIFDRPRPLVANTLRRVAHGMLRYVLQAEQPFIVTCNHGGEHFRGQGLEEPKKTITAAHDAHGLVQPVLASVVINKQHANPPRPVTAPLSTITTNHNKNELMLAHLTTYYGPKKANEARGQVMNTPVATQTTENRHALVELRCLPFMTTFRGGALGQPVDRPAPTVTAGGNPTRPGTGNPHGLVQGYFVPRYGEAAGQQPRAASVWEPTPTVTPSGNGTRLAVATMIRNNGGGLAPQHASYSLAEPARTVLAQGGPQSLATGVLVGIDNASSRGSVWASGQPLTTIVTENRHALATGVLVGVGGRGAQARPKGMGDCMHTVTTKADMALMTAHLTAYYGSAHEVGQAATEPARTVTTKDRLAVTVGTLMRQFGTSNAADAAAPLGTVMPHGQGKTGAVTAHAEQPPLTPAQLARARQCHDLLLEYLGAEVLAPYAHAGLIVLTVHGEEYLLADIHLRMLTPRELARCQGFGDDYVLERDVYGNPVPKSKQVAGVGNSVCPDVAEALVRANLGTPGLAEAAD